MTANALKLENADAEVPVLTVVEQRKEGDSGTSETQDISGDTSGKTASVLAPLIEDAVLNSAGISLLRTNIIAFNKLRVDYPNWVPDFSGENFEEANLDGVNLSGATLIRTSFVSATMRNSNLRGANLTFAQISSVDLTGADLRDTDFSNADLSDSRLHGSDIRGAKMETAEIDTGYLAEITLEDGTTKKVMEVLRIKIDNTTTLTEISNPGIERTTFYIAGEDVSIETLREI